MDRSNCFPKYLCLRTQVNVALSFGQTSFFLPESQSGPKCWVFSPIWDIYIKPYSMAQRASRRKRWKECKNRKMGECCEPGTLSWTHYHCGYLYKIKTAATVSIPASDPILTGLRGLQIREPHTSPQKKEKRKEYVGGVAGRSGGKSWRVWSRYIVLCMILSKNKSRILYLKS